MTSAKDIRGKILTGAKAADKAALAKAELQVAAQQKAPRNGRVREEK